MEYKSSCLAAFDISHPSNCPPFCDKQKLAAHRSVRLTAVRAPTHECYKQTSFKRIFKKMPRTPPRLHCPPGLHLHPVCQGVTIWEKEETALKPPLPCMLLGQRQHMHGRQTTHAHTHAHTYAHMHGEPTVPPLSRSCTVRSREREAEQGELWCIFGHLVVVCWMSAL